MTALVLSAGGMYAAWEAGVWKALAPHFRPDLVVGTSAGAWNGWAIAGGASPDDLIREWMDESLAEIWAGHPQALHRKAQELWSRYRPQMPFGLTLVDARRIRVKVARESEITWQHLAATCSVIGFFPSVRIDGRPYVDGGLLGALPVWVAEEMGATRAIAISCLNGIPFRVLRTILRPRAPSAELPVNNLVPSRYLGPLRDAVRWSRPRMEEWIELGERDGNRLLNSITM